MACISQEAMEVGMIIQSTNVWLGSSFVPAQIEIDGGGADCGEEKCGKIRRVMKLNTEKCDMDYGNNWILPGFIDIHTHGAFGFDTNDADARGLRYWIKNITAEGVTAIMPTTATQEKAALKAALRNVAEVADSINIDIAKKAESVSAKNDTHAVYTAAADTGAEILGIHFEGPYIDKRYRGAQAESAISVPSIEEFKEYQDAAHGMIKCITLSPAQDKDYEFIRFCAQSGVTVSLGHSDADYSDVIMAMANGACSITHVYNGMSPFHHRNAGMTGASLIENELYGEIICDGLHSSAEAVRLFFNAKGAHRAVMITDSLSAKYVSEGKHYKDAVFEKAFTIEGAGAKNNQSDKLLNKAEEHALYLAGQQIELDSSGLARLSKDGTIAGSTLKMNEGLRFLIEEAGVPREAAINSCTINPARCIGVGDRKGKICAGYDADIAVLGKSCEVLDVYCRGRKCYSKEASNNL